MMDFALLRSLLSDPDVKVIREYRRRRPFVRVFLGDHEIFVQPEDKLTYHDYWAVRRIIWKWRNGVRVDQEVDNINYNFRRSAERERWYLEEDLRRDVETILKHREWSK